MFVRKSDYSCYIKFRDLFIVHLSITCFSTSNQTLDVSSLNSLMQTTKQKTMYESNLGMRSSVPYIQARLTLCSNQSHG
jgi:hypothetical protein